MKHNIKKERIEYSNVSLKTQFKGKLKPQFEIHHK